jgi:predicted KAP-like P-loop ATPase
MENDISTTPSLGFYISTDLPIKNKSSDRLNRIAFAETIAKVIFQWHNKPSLVIGLYGNWGSGKSSIKNMVVETLGDKEGK